MSEEIYEVRRYFKKFVVIKKFWIYLTNRELPI